MPQVECLSVEQQLGVVDVKPRPAVDPKSQRQPIGQVDQAFVLDDPAGDAIGQRVVDAGRVRPRVMRLRCCYLRSAATRGDIAVTDGAQRFAQPLVVGVITLINQFPRIARRGRRFVQIVRQPSDETAHRGRISQAEQRGGWAIPVLVVPHRNSHTGELDRVEGVFVGDIVADVDRQHGAAARSLDVFEDPVERSALVPIEVGAKLDDFAAHRDLQALRSPDLACRRDHPVDQLRVRRCGSEPRPQTACAPNGLRRHR